MKINLVGTSGSGKTTFGRRLAGILEIPLIELDALYWGPNWSAPEDDELFRRLREALQTPAWVLDGNYSRARAIKWAEVEAVIWLDYSFPRTFLQALSRALSRIVSREELWPGTGNRESLRKLFSRDSILLWTIQSYGRRKRQMAACLNSDQYAAIRFHRLESPSQAERFLTMAAADPGFITRK